ncbi:MAG: HAD hydrolase family protein, partial [Endomicrobiales bacterium]
FIRWRNKTYESPLMKQDTRWRYLLLRISRCILEEKASRSEDKDEILRMAEELLSFRYPSSLEAQRVKIPSIFRSEDITHHDILQLLANFADDRGNRYYPVVIVGLRTSGAYLAPLAHAYLQSAGFSIVDSVTVRPGSCISSVEEEVIRKGIAQNAEFFIVSEPPRSGHSMAKLLKALGERGVAGNRISAAFPAYPGNDRWKQNAWAAQLHGVRVYCLPWNRWYLTEYLKADNVKKILREYFAAQDLQLISVEESVRNKCIDNRFGKPERIGWRLKQSYKVKLWDREGREHHREVLAKSVGWGWLGYHAYIQADRLKGFVPPLLGLRSGLIFMDWIDGKSGKGPELGIPEAIPRILEYIFARIDRLSLPEDMTFKEDSKKYYGGQFLCTILSKAYGRRLGTLVKPLIRRALQRYATKLPTAIDGKIAPEECIYKDGRIWKIDYEHHGFGTTELNIADPVFDLSSFIFEFRLSEKQREEVVRAYIEHTGDVKAKDKVILYLWLIAHHNLNNEKEFCSESDACRRSIEENRKFASDRKYINLLSMEYFTKLINTTAAEARNRNYFVMNIDGVLDREIWDFPTTTISGIKAISLLHRHGFPILINTARSINEVKAYCEYFAFDGGIAEYGSILWDNHTKRQFVLLDRDTQEELQRMRRIILGFSDIYINPHCSCVIKAFRYKGGATQPLEMEKVEKIIAQQGFGRLKAFVADNDTVIMAKALDKGTGLEAVCGLLSPRPERIISVGYAESDIPMFRRSDLSFAPGDLIERTSELRSRENVKAVKKYQTGLFDAAKFTVKRYCCSRHMSIEGMDGKEAGSLMMKLIKVADQKRLARIFSIFNEMRT